ncbi:MAG TPA: DUF2141 domain-containing protein [Bacteroidota bacterium]|nr:DUF2141 domain-containing protein [Bacteroidota bacterium]
MRESILKAVSLGGLSQSSLSRTGKRRVSRFLLSLTLFMVLAFQPAPDMKGALIVHVAGLRNSNGQIIFSLYNRKDGFPGDSSKTFRYATSGIISDSCMVTFENLPFGQYALFCFHDENSDKKFDRTWYGKPTEGVAFSNNVHGSILGSPSFEDAKFDFRSREDSLKLTISYF